MKNDIDYKNLSNEELDQLMNKITEEKKRRSGIDKGDLLIFRRLWRVLFGVEDIEKLDVVHNKENNLKLDIVRKAEDAIIKICDTTLGNYEIKTKRHLSKATSPNHKAYTLTSPCCNTKISSEIKDEYVNMANDILNVINNHSNRNIIKKIFENSEVNK